MRPPDPEVPPAVLSRALVEALAAQLGDRLDSVLGHGSWVHGDFCPGRSDLDLLVVLRDEPGPELVPAVQPVLDRITAAHPAWRDRLELGFVTASTIQSVLDGNQTSRRVGRVSPGEPLHLASAERHRLLDWEAAHHGSTLYGTPAAQAVPPVPAEAVRRVVGEHLRAWPGWLAESDSPGFRAYAVLTVSRAAAHLATGERHSKRQGARWATARLPAWRPLIHWAVDWWYAGGSDEQAAPAGVRQFVDEMAGADHMITVLRPMEPDDLDRVLAVQEEGSVLALAAIFPQDSTPFPRTDLRQRWLREIDDPGVRCFVVQALDHSVQGFAAVRGDELLHFGTARSTWGSGLARRAHDDILELWRQEGRDRARLRVFEANQHARHFYEHRGWTLTDQRTRSGFPPHPVLLGYERDLSEP